jgi:membrane protein involved in colicin uptake
MAGMESSQINHDIEQSFVDAVTYKGHGCVLPVRFRAISQNYVSSEK